jgi:N-acylneuraminate cytidylyltransferase/CMP-N,N'-diacetyllegionaminic acid synthase
MMNIMAFIPARGGSKGIPKKNLYPLCGKPMIQYTIEAAKESKYINNIFISSDSDEIIDFCKGQGLDVPYKRPSELATDTSTTIGAIDDCFRWLRQEKIPMPDAFVLLQPTSPLRIVEDIDQAVTLFLDDVKKSIVSVNKMIEHPYECVIIKETGFEYLAKPKGNHMRRQDYEEDFYFINGAIYIAKPEFLQKHGKFVVEGQTKFYIMPKERGIDIDEINSVRVAEVCILNREN